MNDYGAQHLDRERPTEHPENRWPDARPVPPESVPLTDGGEPVLDRTRYDELTAFVEPERIRAALVAFRNDLQAHFGLDSASAAPDGLATAAHKLISPAGVVGFGPLAAALAAFEVAVRAGTVVSGALQDARVAVQQALPLVDVLIAEADAACASGPAAEAAGGGA